jgi:prepilin-type N-terminal cleavage/methylation domain-containing protein
MNQRAIRKAFTLIELLTVMAIITLLIGILTPALGAARDRARATAVRAQLNAMEVGLEAFSSDEDGFPPSNANLWASDINNPTAGTDVGNVIDWEVAGGGGTPLLQGAHLLLDVLVGRDFLGYDPKAPGAGAPSTYNRWDSTNDRRKPYIPADGVDVTSVNEPPEDAFGTNPGLAPNLPQPTIDNLLCRVFRDKFGWPILYYRANPTATQNTPIIQTGMNPGAAFYGDGVYDGVDNEVFTSYDAANCTAAPGIPTLAHRICDARDPQMVETPNYGSSLDDTSRFAEFIRSFRASTFDTTMPDMIVQPRPVRSDRFILWSAGKDGIYGNLDDVANFQVLSTER